MDHRLIILAPASGVIVPLDQVGDPAVTWRQHGDGAAIDSLDSQVVAPLAGTVTAAVGRVLVVRNDHGTDVRLQLGLGAGGDHGCTLVVAVGARVEPGTVLARIDRARFDAEVESAVILVQVSAAPAGRFEHAAGLAVAGRTALLSLMDVPAAGRVELLAPVSGVLVPLSQVPDPVFATRMVGDGVSIDPTASEVRAPCAGTVSQLHPSHHALTITSAEGLEILIHVGIDTVTLRGEGFEPLVAQGDVVVAGQPILRFDPDLVGRRAASLLTQMLVANGERVAAILPAHGLVKVGCDVACTVLLATGVVTTAAEPSRAQDAETEVATDPVLLPNPSGLHARPAAALVAEARRFTSWLALERLEDGTRPSEQVNLRSVVAVLRLGTRCGDRVRVLARGADASAASAALLQLLRTGCGEDLASPSAPVVVATPAARPAPKADGLLHGVPASPGVAVGAVYHLRRPELAVPRDGVSIADERQRLSRALLAAGDALTTAATGDADAVRRQILAAHRELLDDPDLHAAAEAGIAQGRSAAFAWRAAVEQQALALQAMDNPLLRERADDLRDVGRRMLMQLLGVAERPVEIPIGAVVVAEDLTPSDTSRFVPGRVMGFCTASGGATSHVAILARSLGIPAVCGIDRAVLALDEGVQVILDGEIGALDPAPDAPALARAADRLARREARSERAKAGAHQPAVTRDGRCIEVAANITGAAEAAAAVAAGADGVGLLRSEFLFDRRATAPGEEEQAAAYLAVKQALAGRPLVVRTLDVGGDKPLAYLPLPREDNPFLGLRGIRVGLAYPELLRTQLRAILRSAGGARLSVMFPMVAGLDEFRAARAMLEEERQALNAPPVEVGVMIEIPSAALLAEQLAREADFFSIGTNDLTQYILAMDRGHSRLAAQADALHPAVLAAIRMACDGAHAHGRWVGVCGGLAADELAVPVLIGLGVDELSVPVPALAGIKAAVSACDGARCRELSTELLSLSTAAEVRARLAQAIPGSQS